MSKKRVIEALKILKEEVPEYFGDVITSDCPSDLGLRAMFKKWCGIEDVNAEFTSEYCKRCWLEALEARRK